METLISNNSTLIKRYYQQPIELPRELKAQVNKLWPKQSLVLYAFLDLNGRYQLTDSWLLLGEKSLVLACYINDKWNFQIVDRKQITSVYELVGLSCTKLIVEGANKQVFLTLNFSMRQARNVNAIKFILVQYLENEKLAQGLFKSSDEVYTQQLIEPVKTAQAAVSGNKMDVIWRLLGLLKPYKKAATLGTLGAILMTLVSLIPAFLTGHFIDNVIKPFQGGLISIDEAKQMAMVTISGLIAVYILREFFAWLRLRTMSVMGELVAKDLRDQVYTHLQKLSLSFFSSKQTGSIISRVGADTDRIWDFVAFGVVEVTTSILMLAGLSSVLIYLDWKLGLIVTIPVPFILWMIYRHGLHMRKLFLKAWRKWSDLTDCLSDTIPGIRVVKAFNREDHETKRFCARNESVVNEFNNIHKTWTRFWPFLMLLIQAIVVSVWFLGVPRVLEHVAAFNDLDMQTDVGLSPGKFIAFILYLGMFVHPIEIIGQMARMVNRATSSAHRVFEVLDTEPQIIVKEKAIKLVDLKGSIEFEDVFFSYDGVRKILKGINFNIQPGEMIGLVGPSGSGKSTITNLISRFYEVSSGEIKIDGVSLKDLDLSCYRQQMGVVLQEPYLFHGSILDNIRYAFPEAPLEQVIEAAVAANAHDICKLPQAYDTIVGERGQSLSGGERQRVSIARAILRNPRILIMDEATSSVDTETEMKIQQALDRLVKGRTTIAIAHRLSTLTQANRLFVLDSGKLVETGSHSELINIENGVYRKLVETQQELHENRIGLGLA